MATKPTVNSTEKLAPNNQESEEATLGSLLINPDLLDDADLNLLDWFHGEDFYYTHHRFVWEAIMSIYDRGDHIDVLTVVTELRERNDKQDKQTYLDKVGGSSFITYLINNTPTHIHIETYARMVARLALRRRILDAGSTLAKLALADDLELEEIVGRIEGVVENLTLRDSKNNGLVHVRDLLLPYLNQLEERHRHQGEPLGIPSGLVDLDRLLGGGFQKNDLIAVGARPGVGKTALLLKFALEASKPRVKGKKPFRVVIFSMEMSREQLLARLFSSTTGIESRKLRSGDLEQEQWDAILGAVDGLERIELMIDDTPNITVKQAKRKLKGMDVDLAIFDYLQLIGAPYGFRADNRTQIVSAISRELKQLAMHYHIPVLAAAQVSRAAALNDNQKPELENLKESGGIEENSDIVIMMHTPKDQPNELNLNVAKHRNGPKGEITVYFQRANVRIVNIDKPAILGG